MKESTIAGMWLLSGNNSLEIRFGMIESGQKYKEAKALRGIIFYFDQRNL